ncbi:MAG: ATP-dependent DNA helicase RecQ [Bacteroidales bacterium]|nr:ATP-dependent DNA helicase RecQ [Bacteroidales bacterium]
MPLKNILAKYWGYTSFRPLQEEIINSVLQGNDTLALLPTGGGKSICFQVPAMAQEGICLVITPLIALMKDQVENLKKKGINAVAIYSGMNYHEIELAFDNCMFGDVKFLYLSPERLETEKFRAILPRLKVCLLAVDEAHCISQWGYDFRPPYLRIAEIRQLLPDIPVLALTATATPAVVIDIQSRLKFKYRNLFQQSFQRSNLTYVVQQEEDKLGRILKICNNIRGTGIVYVRNRRRTREIAEFLVKNKIPADYYHAGLETLQRDKRQTAWMQGQSRVIVATNAFGMGIDKPNVRFVIHLDLPDSLEAYFQEAGRAGRDLNASWAVVLYQKNDIIDLRHSLSISYPPLQTIKNVYESLGNYLQLATGSGKDVSFDFDLHDFGRQYKVKPIIAYNALKFLEKEGYIMLNEEIGAPSMIHMTMNKENLYRFQVENMIYDPFIKLLLRSYTGLFSGYAKINESEIARRAGIETGKVVELLILLDKSGVINYVPRKQKPQIVFTTERLDVSHLHISPENYGDRLESAKQRVESVIQYMTSSTKCRSQLLLAYFGETDGQRCGKCDVCIELNRIELSELEFKAIYDQLEKLLKQKTRSINELVDGVSGANEDKVIKAIQWLHDHDKITTTDDQKYTWSK